MKEAKIEKKWPLVKLDMAIFGYNTIKKTSKSELKIILQKLF